MGDETQALMRALTHEVAQNTRSNLPTIPKRPCWGTSLEGKGAPDWALID